jgi:hypothetical protein
MPLERHFRGRLVTRTRRRGNHVLIRLTDPRAIRSRHYWVSVPLHEYARGRTTVFSNKTGASN